MVKIGIEATKMQRELFTQNHLERYIFVICHSYRKYQDVSNFVLGIPVVRYEEKYSKVYLQMIVLLINESYSNKYIMTNYRIYNFLNETGSTSLYILYQGYLKYRKKMIICR